jgi:hypothetical protein
MPDRQNDSPLSITASIAGILTFLAAIAATLYVRFTYLRNADSEYFQVKASLSWYKTESTFMLDLLRATYSSNHSGSGSEREKEMYLFVVEELARLETRLLEVVEEAEMKASNGEREVEDGKGKQKGWTIVPRGVRGKTDIAMSWLPVRAKALELVRQRDALGSRVLFAQMSMISSCVSLCSSPLL